MTQNRSSAVMQQRAEPHDSLDFFPTPPWATRALMFELMHPFGFGLDLSRRRCWEPACGQGHMARPLAEYFEIVYASDVHTYGFGDQRDFLWPGETPSFDWVITNPPFRLAQQFIERGLDVASEGVAMLVRTAFLEGIDRYRKMFVSNRPTAVYQFAERVAMVKGCVDPDASSATAYCWLVWHKNARTANTKLEWIPPCRRQLERPGDYDAPKMLETAA